MPCQEDVIQTTQFLNSGIPAGLLRIEDLMRFEGLLLGPNDSSINRGDREDTGDNEAQPDEMGSGSAHSTVDPTSLGGTTSIGQPDFANFDAEEELQENDGFEIVEATDRRLGLTNLDGQSPDDWAADTGKTRNPDAQ